MNLYPLRDADPRYNEDHNLLDTHDVHLSTSSLFLFSRFFITSFLFLFLYPYYIFYFSPFASYCIFSVFLMSLKHLLSIGPFPVSFLYFVCSKQLRGNEICRWLDSNCGSLVCEANILTTEPNVPRYLSLYCFLHIVCFYICLYFFFS